MIYLDYQATTPLCAEARAAMLAWMGDQAGNPHAANRAGRAAAAAIEIARDQVTAALDAPPAGRLVFTSGATEAANMAILGGWRLMQPRRAIVTVATEHNCVLETARWAARNGAELRVIGVDAEGLIDLDEAATLIDAEVALVAVMAVNNEIGVIQPLAELSALAHASGALFFCDAVQGYGRTALPLDTIDMVAITAHKIYGPAGIGALWLRDGLALPPLLHGGGQQEGLRPGTLPTALCAGFGAAAARLAAGWEDELRHAEAMFHRAVDALGPDWRVNGSVTRRYPGNLNVRRDGIDANRLISEVRDVAFSAGSACASDSGRPSHVLTALGLGPDAARSSIRLGFGTPTTADAVDEAMARINAAAERQLIWA
jgi:cysteine desulfurase